MTIAQATWGAPNGAWYRIAMVMMGLLAGSAVAAEPAMKSAHADEGAAVKLTDPLTQLVASSDTWSVSNTVAGCYLLSPREKGSSSLAIGRHPKFGLGLFLVGFAISVPIENAGEPVMIQAEGRNTTGTGRVVGSELLFVPLSHAAVERSVREIRNEGALWLMIRNTWITHGGQAVLAALTKYGQICDAAPDKS